MNTLQTGATFFPLIRFNMAGAAYVIEEKSLTGICLYKSQAHSR
jgi:hypothetical protein